MNSKPSDKSMTPAIAFSDERQVALLAGTVLSRSVFYCLKREFLNTSLREAKHLRAVVPPEGGLAPAHFLLFEQVGHPVDPHLTDAVVAIQTALSACHLPNRHSLLFVISNDGRDSRVFLGIRSYDEDLHPGYEFTANLGQLLCSNWSGTKMRLCSAESEIYQQGIAFPLEHLKHAVTLTGIPGVREQRVGATSQSLDRLISAMRGERFAYMVVADPVSDTDLDSVIFACREMVGQIHALSKNTFSETTTEGRSVQTTEERIVSEMEQTKEDSRRRDANKDLAWRVGVIAGLLSEAFPPAALVAGAAGLAYLCMPEGVEETKSSLISKTETQSLSYALGLSESLSQTTGREIINAHAQAAEQFIQQYITRLEKQRSVGSWNVGVYLLSDSAQTVRRGAQYLRALMEGGEIGFEPIRCHDLSACWNPAGAKAVRSLLRPPIVLCEPEAKELRRVQHPLGHMYTELSSVLTGEELALWINAPQREVPGVSVIPAAAFSLNPSHSNGDGILLGHAIESGVLDDGNLRRQVEYRISRKSLAKHVLVTGVTGSGKSVTCRRLLDEALTSGVQFMVIEPAKEEYVEWAVEINAGLPSDSPDRIKVFIPGQEQWRGQPLFDSLSLNPFDLVWLDPRVTPQVTTHIDRLKGILCSVFPMQEVLPFLLEDLIFHVYRIPGKNWLAEPLPGILAYRPTLIQVMNHIEPLVKSKGYDARITANITAALRTRIQSLRQGWKRSLFDRPRSTPWADLFDGRTVVNLSYLGDDDEKAFAMSILLQFLYEYRQAQAELARLRGEPLPPLRHLAFVEEAHRILRRPVSSTTLSANPQAKTAEFFSNMLSEIRSLGQGLAIVDQVPARLIPDAIKNTNLKIVHRLLASDDRDEMSACMGLTPDQTRVLNRLRPGQAIVFGDMDDGASLIQCLMSDKKS